MDKFHYIKSYIKYIFCARHFRGGGVHSPFVFHLIRSVFREKNAYYIYNNVEKIRRRFLNNDTELKINDLGTDNHRKQKISAIACQSLKNAKYSQLLFRLANHAKPDVILELGASLGITTMYLAAVNSKARCITIEGCPQILETAKAAFQKNKFANIEAHCGNIDNVLPDILQTVQHLDFVFFDANHTENATLNYFTRCVEKVRDKSVFVFDDIYWSAGMTRAWKAIKQHPRVRVSIDIFEMGILYFDRELQKGDYLLRF